MVLALLLLSLSLSGYYLLFKESGFDHSLAKRLLDQGMPTTARSFVDETSGDRFDLASFLHWLTSFNLQDPLSLIEATLPVSLHGVVDMRMWEERPFVFIQELSFAPDPVRPPSVLDSPSVESMEVRLTGPKVLIYHTHTSENYLGRAGVSNQPRQAHYQFRNMADPTITGVMAVGRHLSNALTSLGVQTVHESRIHTLPTINSSYSNSEKTVREILSKQKDFDMVIDLHRDAGVPNPTVVINGREVARLVLVVGTAQNIPLSHPNFQENLDFAYKIKSVCDAMYPGLMRPVQVHREARYNQHLHPASLIVELGSVETTLEEALLAAELLASVLVKVL
jgi:stage II sporulation protein P